MSAPITPHGDELMFPVGRGLIQGVTGNTLRVNFGRRWAVDSAWSAATRLVYAAQPGTCAVLDVLGQGAAFDVLVNVGVGRNLMQVVTCYELFIAVRDLTGSCTVARSHIVRELHPARSALTQTLAAPIGPDWQTDEGAVLEIVATLKVTAGINHSYSFGTSPRLIVINP